MILVLINQASVLSLTLYWHYTAVCSKNIEKNVIMDKCRLFASMHVYVIKYAE